MCVCLFLMLCGFCSLTRYLVLCLCCLIIFFFKQKTAYEMRISDWSSDVCSSDLRHTGDPPCGPSYSARGARTTRRSAPLRSPARAAWPPRSSRPAPRNTCRRRRCGLGDRSRSRRSEEHTSELQSLMRISYAVFCLKKKKYRTTKHTHD